MRVQLGDMSASLLSSHLASGKDVGAQLARYAGLAPSISEPSYRWRESNSELHLGVT